MSVSVHSTGAFGPLRRRKKAFDSSETSSTVIPVRRVFSQAEKIDLEFPEFLHKSSKFLCVSIEKLRASCKGLNLCTFAWLTFDFCRPSGG